MTILENYTKQSKKTKQLFTYSASAVYNVGDVVIQNNEIYQCNTQILIPEAFTIAKWTLLGSATGAFIYQGIINVAADFPTPALVVNGWTYVIKTNVTDNDATKTNTGQSFLIGDVIAWNGTTWDDISGIEVWIEDSGSAKTINALDIDSQAKKFISGSNTEMYESGGDSIRENTSATGNIIDKLGDALGVTFHYFKDSAGTVIGYISSAGEWLLGKAGEVGSVAVRNASNVITIFLNANGDSYYNGGNNIFGGTIANSTIDNAGSASDKVTTVSAATYTIQDDDNTISVKYTPTGIVDLTLPSATSAWNSTESTGKKYKIMDSGANSGINRIRTSRVGSDTIIVTTTGNTFVDLATNGGVILIQAISATEWKVL